MTLAPGPQAGTESGSGSVPAALAAVVARLGGVHRPGQEEMALAVAQAAATGQHLLVQAGTGTGKSVAYLVPAVLHAITHDEVIVVSTATIALQQQIVDRDLPAVLDALAPLLPRLPEVAILKGRGNYLCVHRAEGGLPADADNAPALFEAAPASSIGREVIRLRAWAETTTTGDRDELAPGVSDRAWSQVSVSARECVGGQRCPAADRCFAESARDVARHADIVVTNHALLAIDAVGQVPLLPDHDLLVVDEAHDLADRVTAVATSELSLAALERAVARLTRLVDKEVRAAVAQAGEGLGTVLDQLPDTRLDTVPTALIDAVRVLLAAAREAHTALTSAREVPDGARALARAALDALTDPAERILAGSDGDVVWCRRDDGRGPVVYVAPLRVAGLLAETVFSRSTVVLTSATLALGGRFDHVAAACGLPPHPDDQPSGLPPHPDDQPSGLPAEAAAHPSWRGLDVGSPFDYPRQAILYVASHLPPPGRDGISDAALDELAALVEASGGRTLGLFSSTRGAQRAAEAIRGRLDVPILCQGEDRMATLVRTFSDDERACLFGTLSLWQGVDVPGPSCQLVVIDRLPFPRPDDPLASARARDVDQRGGNGFLSVSAAHAALRLAQGAGRLVRGADDRGVVAVLDSRLATARYGPFLRASMPPFWHTTDRETVLGALARLRATRGTD